MKTIYNNNEPDLWSTDTLIPINIYAFTDKEVHCDCIMDTENLILERRIFPRELFENFVFIEIHIKSMLSIKTKPGSSRIDILNDDANVANSAAWFKKVEMKINEGIENLEGFLE